MLRGWGIRLQVWDLEHGLESAGVVCRGLRHRCDISLEATAEVKFLAMVSVHFEVAGVGLELGLRLDDFVAQDRATFVVISVSIPGIIEALTLTPYVGGVRVRNQPVDFGRSHRCNPRLTPHFLARERLSLDGSSRLSRTSKYM